MSTLVGKKFKYTGYSYAPLEMEVVQELPMNQMLCKYTKGDKTGKHNVYNTTLSEYWKEVREPRVIYINDYDGSNGFKGLSQSHYPLEETAKSWKVGGFIATRKFIEVLD